MKILKNISETLDRGEVLNSDQQALLDQELINMMGEEEYAKLQEDLQVIHNDAITSLNNILDNIDIFT